MIRKPIGYWTKENCLLEASKYLTRGEFKLGCGSAYKVARKNGWLDLVTWNKQPKKRYFWNYYTCKEEAKKYNTRYAFKKGSYGAYQVAVRNKWTDEWFGEKKNKVEN